MRFKVKELIRHSEIDVYEISLVEQVEQKGRYKDKLEGWDLRIFTPLNPIRHPNPEISDIIDVRFDPILRWDTRDGKYITIKEPQK